jgi:hypothetical protein
MQCLEDMSCYAIAPDFPQQIVLADAMLGPAFAMAKLGFKLAVMAVVIRACHEEGLGEDDALRFVELVHGVMLESPE